MADIGDAQNLIILSQNVSLMVGDVSTTTTPDTYVLMREVVLEKDHPEVRTNYGNTRTYNHASPDISLSFKLSLSSDVLADLTTKSTRNTRGILPTVPFQIKCISNNDTTKNLQIKGLVPYYKIQKSDGDAEDPGDVDVRIRITDETVTIT